MLRVRVGGVLEDKIATPFTLSPMREPEGAAWNPAGEATRLPCRFRAPLFVLIRRFAFFLPPGPGIGRVVPGGRDPPPRAPGRAAPRLRGLGLTRRCCGVSWRAELSGSGRACKAHGAPIPSALQALDIGIMLEDIRTVDETQRLPMLDLARPPGNPPGSPGALLRRGPLRTERATLTALGSSKPHGRRGRCCFR